MILDDSQQRWIDTIDWSKYNFFVTLEDKLFFTYYDLALLPTCALLAIFSTLKRQRIQPSLKMTNCFYIVVVLLLTSIEFTLVFLSKDITSKNNSKSSA